MKEDKYTKSLTKNQVCTIFEMQDIREKRFNQIYKASYGNTMCGRRKLTETSVF